VGKWKQNCLFLVLYSIDHGECALASGETTAIPKAQPKTVTRVERLSEKFAIFSRVYCVANPQTNRVAIGQEMVKVKKFFKVREKKTF